MSRIPETDSSRQEDEVNMHATEMKHAANLEEWKKRIMACRASGLTVREWCSRNAWSTSTYYRWEREAFRALGEPPDQPGNSCTAIAPASGQSLVEIPRCRIGQSVACSSGSNPNADQSAARSAVHGAYGATGRGGSVPTCGSAARGRHRTELDERGLAKADAADKGAAFPC